MRTIHTLALAAAIAAALSAAPAAGAEADKTRNFDKIDWLELRTVFAADDVSVLDHMKRKQRSSSLERPGGWLPDTLGDALQSLTRGAEKALKMTTKQDAERSAEANSAPELSWGWNAT